LGSSANLADLKHLKSPFAKLGCRDGRLVDEAASAGIKRQEG
jgi:hypothetical protein